VRLVHQTILINKFNLKRQMGVNLCPLHSLAFPAFVFKEIGIRFDESLNTTEDWDFLMRTALFTGVADKKEITCIYRLWRNAENSHTVFDKAEWKENHLFISDRLRSMPMVLLPNAYDDVFGPRGKFTRVKRPEDNQLFYDNGEGFNSECMLIYEDCDRNSDYCVEFTFEEEIGEVFALRFDPVEKGGLAINNLQIKIEFVSGNELVYKMNDVMHNGIRLKAGEIVYLQEDPQVVIEFEKGEKIRKVYARYDSIEPLNDEIIQRLLNNYDIRQKIKERVRGRIKGVCGRIRNAFKRLA